MAAVNVTNKHDATLTVGGVPLHPGRTASISHWERVKAADPVKSWIDLGLIEEEGKSPKPQDPEASDLSEKTNKAKG